MKFSTQDMFEKLHELLWVKFLLYQKNIIGFCYC